jgi:hypothetical protein
MAVILATALLPRSDPDRALKDIEGELARHQRVVLIGETGAPRSSRWCAGAERSQTSTARDGSFSVHSWDVGLLELVHDPGRTYYRIRAQVRHEKSDDTGEVGIYFCHCQWPTTDGAEAHCFVQLTFNDIKDAVALHGRLPPMNPMPPAPQGNPVSLLARLYALRQGEVVGDDRIAGLVPELFRPAGFGGGPWRSLAVEVTPSKCSAYWEANQSLGAAQLLDLVSRAEDAARERGLGRGNDLPLQQAQPGFPWHGALGLYVQRSSASFRSVVIEPLPEE